MRWHGVYERYDQGVPSGKTGRDAARCCSMDAMQLAGIVCRALCDNICES